MEKNHQVRLMSRIYTQSSSGLIYLGPEADGSEILGELFNDLIESLAGGLRFGNTRSRYRAYWPAFRAFLRRPWFRRLWVVQEFALPKSITMVCGHCVLDAMFLVAVTVLLAVMEPALEWGGDCDDQAELEDWAHGGVFVNRLQNIRSASHPHWLPIPPEVQTPIELVTYSRMLDLVQNFKAFEVTDPRDRFYGLLGLAMDLDDDPDLSPDYSKANQEYQECLLRAVHPARQRL